MKNRKTFFGLALLLAVLTLGIGYAALSNVTLNITGTATGTPDSSNFKVELSEQAEDIVVDKTAANANVAVDAKVTDTLNASLTVSNMSTKNETVVVTYIIKNHSKDLSAELSVNPPSVVDSNFEITTSLTKDKLTAGESTTVTVTVKLLVTPILNDVSTNFNFVVEAVPVQP